MSKNKCRNLGIFLSLALLILSVFGFPANAQAAPNWFDYKKCVIKNYATNRPLNIYATSPENIYNGVKVNTFSNYVGDGTQWFYVDRFSLPFFPWDTGTTAILSENETYALNIGYRVEGSKAVMYDKNLDLETWDIERVNDILLDFSGNYYMIKLHSASNLYLAENPVTHDVYLADPRNCSDQELQYLWWKIDTMN